MVDATTKARPATPAVEEIVNLKELAYILGTSANTLSRVIEGNDDFPVLTRGTNGKAYEFDRTAATDWWKANEQKHDEAATRRQDQLQLWRQEIFGEDPDEANADMLRLDPKERREELAAQTLEDKLRRDRNELIDRGQMEILLSAAVIALRNGLLQVPAEFSRAEGLTREQRLALEKLITGRLEGLAAKLTTEDFYGDGANRTAAA